MRTFLHGGIIRKLLDVHISRAALRNSRGSWLTAKCPKATSTLHNTLAQSGVITSYNFDSWGGSGKADFLAAARKSVDRLTSCTNKAFQSGLIENSTQNIYNVLLPNLVSTLKLPYLDISILLDELHPVQKHFQNPDHENRHLWLR